MKKITNILAGVTEIILVNDKRTTLSIMKKIYKKTLMLLLVLCPILSLAQSWQWAQKIGGTGTDIGNSIAVDKLGNVYVTGVFSGSATFGSNTLVSNGLTDIFIAKYDASGVLQWAQMAGGANDDEGSAICVDTLGNTYITGYFTGSAIFGSNTIYTGTGTGRDFYVAKYNSTGSIQWVLRSGSTAGNDYGKGISINNSGNLYVTGSFMGTGANKCLFINATGTWSGFAFAPTGSGAPDIFVAKISASTGAYQWVQQAGGTSYDYGYSIACDSIGNSFITGNFYSSATFNTTTITSNSADASVFVAKYNNAGTIVWAKAAATQLGGIANGNAITIDPLGNSYVTGYFSNSQDFGSYTLSTSSYSERDVFVANYNSTGTVVWAKSYNYHNGDDAKGICTDKFFNCYVATNTSILKYDNLGNESWSSLNLNGGNSITADSYGACYLTGNYSGTVAWGSTTLTFSGGYSDVFTSKLLCSGVTGISDVKQNVETHVIVTGDKFKSDTDWILYDMSGRTVMNGGPGTFTVKNTGLYIISTKYGSKKYFNK